MRLWITVLAAVALLSGCGLPGPMRHATPLGPWPETAPDGSPLTGTFEEGVSAGSEAAREPSTVGNYFGGVMTPFALPLCVIGATTFAVCMASGAPISSVTDEDEPPKGVKLQQPIAITLKDGSLEKGFLDAVGGGFVQLRDTEGRTRRIRESDIEDATQF